MKASFREKLLLLALAAVLVIYLGVQFLLKPAMADYQTAQQELQAAQEDETAARQVLNAASNTSQATESALSSALAAADGLLPEMTKEQVHEWLVPLATGKGLTISSLTLGDAQAADVATVSAATQSSANYQLRQYAQQIDGTSSSPSGSSSSASSSASSASGSASSASSGSGTLLAYQVSLSATCTQAQMESFLDALRDYSKSVVVNTVQFTPQGSGSASLALTVYCAQKPSSP